MITIKGSDSFLSNTASLIVQAITAPNETTIIDFSDDSRPASPANKDWAPGKPWFTMDAARREPRPPIVASPRFNYVLLAVFALTVAAGCVQVWMAFQWITPTPMQQTAFEAMAGTWKVGFGAIVGLLGGKVSN